MLVEKAPEEVGVGWGGFPEGAAAGRGLEGRSGCSEVGKGILAAEATGAGGGSHRMGLFSAS